MISEEILYKKVGKRYVPISAEWNTNMLSSGYWWMKIEKGSHHIINSSYVAELIKVADLKPPYLKLCNISTLAEHILDNWMKYNGLSLHDMIYKIVKDIYDYSHTYIDNIDGDKETSARTT